MPTYKVTNNDNGKVYKITADRAPTSSEVEEIFKQPGTELKKDKKNGWIPVVGGALGGLLGGAVGSLAGGIGAVPGAGLGAAAGTGGGIVVQETLNSLMGNNNRPSSDYTGNTKMGMPELSKQGRVNTAIGLGNNLKDVGLAGATGAAGAAIGGLGPAGKGILPMLGRVGAKTAASTALGAGTGFASPDLQSSMNDRVSGAKTGAIVGGVTGLAGSLVQEKADAIKKAISISKKTLEPIKSGQAPSLSKGLASQATGEASSSSHNFSKPNYWMDFADNVKKMTPQERVKNIPAFFKQLSVETNVPVKDLEKIGIDNIDDFLASANFKGGNTVSILEGLGLRRQAAQAAYDSTTPVNKVIQLFTGIKKSNVMAAARNKAFNEQIQKVLGIKTWDKVVSLYKSPAGTMARNAALYKLLGPTLGRLLGNERN